MRCAAGRSSSRGAPVAPWESQRQSACSPSSPYSSRTATIGPPATTAVVDSLQPGWRVYAAQTDGSVARIDTATLAVTSHDVTTPTFGTLAQRVGHHGRRHGAAARRRGRRTAGALRHRHRRADRGDPARLRQRTGPAGHVAGWGGGDRGRRQRRRGGRSDHRRRHRPADRCADRRRRHHARRHHRIRDPRRRRIGDGRRPRVDPADARPDVRPPPWRPHQRVGHAGRRPAPRGGPCRGHPHARRSDRGAPTVLASIAVGPSPSHVVVSPTCAAADATPCLAFITHPTTDSISRVDVGLPAPSVATFPLLASPSGGCARTVARDSGRCRALRGQHG